MKYQKPNHVNEQGIGEICAFLRLKHKVKNKKFNELVGSAFVFANSELKNNRPPTITIAASDSISGENEDYTVSSSGVGLLTSEWPME